MVQSFLWSTVYLVQLDHFSLCTAGRTDFQVVDGDSPAWHKPSGGIKCQGCVEFHPGPKDVKHSSYSEERDWAEGARCTIIMHAHIWREMPCRAVFTYCLHSTADIYLHEQKSSRRRVHTRCNCFYLLKSRGLGLTTTIAKPCDGVAADWQACKEHVVGGANPRHHLG